MAADQPVSTFVAFLPEVLFLVGLLTLFGLTLGEGMRVWSRRVSVWMAISCAGAILGTWGTEAVLFDGAYRVDGYSQWLKLAFLLGYLGCVEIGRTLPGIRGDIRPEYFFLLGSAVAGFLMLASSIDLITLVVALELSSFPLFLLIAMRKEVDGQRSQMESAVKYMMFGIGASALMLFGLGYLYGLTGTTSLPLLLERLADFRESPLALVGLGLALAAFFYKLAVFPFHFWTPDVYQGSSHETAAVVGSLPKLAAVLLLVRFLGAGQEGPSLAPVLALLAVGSMFLGNLLALRQSDFKRLLGFSAIAHAGYTLVGLTALNAAGFTAALYYTTGYLFMVLACFTVLMRVAANGANLPVSGLGGLHRRSPLLAATLLVGVFSLAGIPPFVGFMGKFSLLVAALGEGYLWLVVLAVLNTVIAVYYYLRIIHAAYFCDPPTGEDGAAIPLDLRTRVLCLSLIVIVIGLGIAPGAFLGLAEASIAQ